MISVEIGISDILIIELISINIYRSLFLRINPQDYNKFHILCGSRYAEM